MYKYEQAFRNNTLSFANNPHFPIPINMGIPWCHLLFLEALKRFVEYHEHGSTSIEDMIFTYVHERTNVKPIPIHPKCARNKQHVILKIIQYKYLHGYK